MNKTFLFSALFFSPQKNVSHSLLGVNCVLLHQENDVDLHGIMAWLTQALLHFAGLLWNCKVASYWFLLQLYSSHLPGPVFVFPDLKAQCLNYGQRKDIRKRNVLICLLTAVLTGIYFKVQLQERKWLCKNGLFLLTISAACVHFSKICRLLLT